jgi:ligand-binding SRPBCC domain-containing protein
MSMPRSATYSRSVDIDAPIDALYRFHLDTRNAPLISPDAAVFEGIEGTFPVQAGSRVVLRVKQPPIPITQTWRILIAEIEVDRRVVDVAERSPFAYWRHEHRFAPLPGGGTRMTDHVTYALPFGPLGRLADRYVGRRQLEKMFAERQRKTKALFEGPDRPQA